MTEIKNLNKIKGVIQNYAWGGYDYIPELVGVQSNSDPSAEYWLGAHKNAPSTLSDTGLSLDKLIEANPEKALSQPVNNRFGRLPFLFKVLDVKDMLSIQVHPTKSEAEKGYLRENELGISPSAPNRNYKDDNHKPEIMVALSEFWLLHGFKPANELIDTLSATPELKHLIDTFHEVGYKGLYQKVMEESADDTQRTLQPLIDRIIHKYEQNSLDKSTSDFWAARAYKTFCEDGVIDKGIYSVYFLNLVKAIPGQAVFQSAGIPHAYLEGQNIELMANSDNVLRGGLTPKHVDVPELLKHVAFEETIPNVQTGKANKDGTETCYESPVDDFDLSKITLKENEAYRCHSSSMEIILGIEGTAKIESSGISENLSKGEAIAIIANTEYQISGTNGTVLYKASASDLSD